MSLKLAQDFASLVDGNQFDEALEYLSEECSYRYSEGKYTGRSFIMNTYRKSHMQSKKVYDEVVYSSTVEEQPDGTIRINFLDTIRKADLWHEFRCYEIVSFVDERITTIEHFEIPGEAKSMRAFYNSLR